MLAGRSVEIRNRQSAIDYLLPVHHLYLHVPFCARRCSYCDFSIAVRRRVPAREYVAAVRAELAAAAALGPLETVYFGGGTPSLLPPEALATLILDVGSSTPLLDAVEITLEANPEDVTPASVRGWRAAGVNRVSLGVQSFDDRILSWMHRVHDAAQARRAVYTLRDAGVENVSLDLIFGLPAELHRDWRSDLDTALALGPEHLSLYGLTVEPRTPLARWIARGRTGAPSDERYAEEYLLAHAHLTADGYTFYEVSNAARPGHRSRHNSAYWYGAAYLGVGPAAHSFDGHVRRWNLSAWEAYRRAIGAGHSPTESEETLSSDERALERLYLGLRTIEGVAAGLTEHMGATLAPLLERGWLRRSGDRLQCTPEGWLRLDAMVGVLTAPATTS